MADPKQPNSSNMSRLGKHAKRARRASRLKRTLTFLFTCFILASLCAGALLFYLKVKDLPVTKVSQTSEMYDSKGNKVDTINSGQNRQVVPLKDISSYLANATLSIEDQHFYDHMGVDPKAIARAVIVNIKHMSKVQGGGTITQQLARNLYLSHEKTWTRKIKESVYAVQMELHMSKEEILEKYLNQIYYGHGAYGAEAAAQMYFGKHAKDLTLAESALLAGIPKGPKYYSPYADMKNATERQKVVLSTMVNTGSITQEEADKAKEEHISIRPQEENEANPAPYFRDYIKSIAMEKLDMPEEEFELGGFKIYTTLDTKAQKAAEDVIAKNLGKNGDLQTALVAIDPRTGYIKAMVGGRNYKENQFNRVFASTRQPGSSFKPFVYLTAIEQGISPATHYTSEPTTFKYDNGRQTYAPGNFNNQFFGSIDMREAVAHSDNIYAVHTILEVGPDKVINKARKMGITSDMKPLPSLALGTYPVSPFEMASAFSAIANQGVRMEPTAITKIEDMSGKVLYEAKPKSERIADPGPSYVLTQLMESVFEQEGTGSRVAKMIKRPVAGKTGTTDHDAWMVGFTPELATAVWVGYDKDRAINSVESHLASPIFAEFTEEVLESVPPKSFEVPDGVTIVQLDKESGLLSNSDCPNSHEQAFIAGTEPKQYCTNKSDKGKEGGGDSWWSQFKRWWNGD
ncbi:penicillin-binding protein 1A [Paenibacillus larvae]